MTKNTQGLIGIGTVINGNYVILEIIGKGGMGEVYRAHQLNLKRDVAIKVVSQEFFKSRNADEQEIETSRSRFRREVKAMAQIRHPNVVQVFDNGSALIKKEDGDMPIEYIVMEYIPGATLRFSMPEGGFFPREKDVSGWIMKYFFPVLAGVQAVHEGGVIHRDLKPENFLLDGDIPKITDFGLARSVKLEAVTESMDVVGTPPFMAPDHFYDFRRVDQRGDIYSLGKILFEAVEGKTPPNSIPFKSAKLRNPESPFFQALDRIIQKATAEDKSDRLESVEKLRDALQQAIDELEAQSASPAHPSYRKPSGNAPFKWLWVGITVAIFSMAGMTVWHLAGNPWGKPKPLPANSQPLLNPNPSNPSRSAGSEPTAPANVIMGQDGIAMRLISGGVLRMAAGEEGGRADSVHLPSFYMDETKVSVSQFVEFLNGVREDLSVEKGVVKHGGEIWILLGEENEGDGQIIYQHDRFHLRDLKKAAQPVVRVTWYGASAYAKYVGKRLPTEYEWEYAAQNIQSAEGLKDMGGKMKEWVAQLKEGQKLGEQTMGPRGKNYYSSLVVGKSFPSKETGPQRIFRIFGYPWEGFFDVGFRCVRV